MPVPGILAWILALIMARRLCEPQSSHSDR